VDLQQRPLVSVDGGDRRVLARAVDHLQRDARRPERILDDRVEVRGDDRPARQQREVGHRAAAELGRFHVASERVKDLICESLGVALLQYLRRALVVTVAEPLLDLVVEPGLRGRIAQEGAPEREPERRRHPRAHEREDPERRAELLDEILDVSPVDLCEVLLETDGGVHPRQGSRPVERVGQAGVVAEGVRRRAGSGEPSLDEHRARRGELVARRKPLRRVSGTDLDPRFGRRLHEHRGALALVGGDRPHPFRLAARDRAMEDHGDRRLLEPPCVECLGPGHGRLYPAFAVWGIVREPEAPETTQELAAMEAPPGIDK
jgi:hypothetical protein